MKKILTLLTVVLLLPCIVWGTFPDETLHYRVMFKWGLINKQAGRATITLHADGDNYRTCLTARSESWADRFYCVRDTLNGLMAKTGLRPLFYEKIAHEGGEYKHDTVRFSYSGNIVTGNCTRQVIKKGRETVNKTNSLQSTGLTVDMLSSFYYMRSLPFEKWSEGHKQSITIFSGKRKETLTFQYHGTEQVKIDNNSYHCYHITFIFTGESGKKTSDNMDAWITADASRIPVKLEGKLPVGKVRCLLVK